MSKDFERVVCRKFDGLFGDHGYERSGRCAFVRHDGQVQATVWLIEGQSSLGGQFMPRLSIGLSALGDEIAVLSTDLHVLVSPERTFWYPWREDGAAGVKRAERDLVAAGLPWLQRHSDLDELAKALEESVGLGAPRQKPRRWWQIGGEPKPQRPRVNSNSLRFLSFVREAQGRYADALEWWCKYSETLTLVQEGSDLQKDLRERRRALERLA